MADSKLTLQEQLLLVCLEARTGELHQPHFRYLLSGAALAELLRLKRITLELGQVQIRQTTPVGDRAIDDVFVRLGTVHRPQKPSYWVHHLYTGQNEAVKILGDRLTERGILTAIDHRALWIVKWTTYPVLEPAHVQKLHRQIHAAIQGDTPVAALDPDLATLIALLYHGKALNRVISETEIFEREHRIASIIASDPVSYAVGKALSDALIEDAMEQQRGAGAPVVIVGPPHHRRPPHHRPPHRHPRRPERGGPAPFPGPRPDRRGVWSIEVEENEEEDSAPV